MRLIGLIILASLILCVVRAAIFALIVVLSITLIWGACYRPKHTFGFVALMMLGEVLQRYGVALVCAAAVAFVGAYFARRKDSA